MAIIERMLSHYSTNKLVFHFIIKEARFSDWPKASHMHLNRHHMINPWLQVGWEWSFLSNNSFFGWQIRSATYVTYLVKSVKLFSNRLIMDVSIHQHYSSTIAIYFWMQAMLRFHLSVCFNFCCSLPTLIFVNTYKSYSTWWYLVLHLTQSSPLNAIFICTFYCSTTLTYL